MEVAYLLLESAKKTSTANNSCFKVFFSFITIVYVGFIIKKSSFKIQSHQAVGCYLPTYHQSMGLNRQLLIHRSRIIEATGLPRDYDATEQGSLFESLSTDPERLQLDAFLYGLAHQCHLASEVRKSSYFIICKLLVR
jgi:hypothetical protein